MSANGSSNRTSGGTQEGSPVTCIGGRFFRIGRRGNAILTSATRAGSGAIGVAIFGSAGVSSVAARLSFVSHGSLFGFVSSSMIGAGVEIILNGMRTGAGFGAVAGIDDSGFCDGGESWKGASIPAHRRQRRRQGIWNGRPA